MHELNGNEVLCVCEVVTSSQTAIVKTGYGFIATQEEMENPEIVKEIVNINGADYNVVRG